MKYKKIEFFCGCTIDEAVKRLLEYKETGENVYIEFNGVNLYSTTVNINDAYILITGMNKQDYDEKIRKEHEEYKQKEKEHELKIPELTEEWIKKGHDILDIKYWDKWDEIVPIRLKDLYHGMELKCCLEIIKMLNNGEPYENCKFVLDDQGHSGMSYSLVSRMIYEFCDEGQHFSNYINNKEI